MDRIKYLWIRYGTQRNIKVLYLLMTLAALVVAGGAPGDGSGSPGGS
jgi:hypothetical protein